jgi:hypothetical protein
MGKRFYFFYLEIALKDPNDLNIYAYENLSHIPTGKLVEIFKIDLVNDPYILEGYFLTKTQYKKHKKFLAENTCALNLDVFEYSLRQYVAEDYSRVRRLYKEELME